MGDAAIDGAPVLDVRGLGFRAGERWILQDLNLRVEAGTVTALLGANAQGKSTLLRLVAGILTPAGGDIRVSDAAHPGGRDVAVVLESPAEQFVAGTVGEEIELTLAHAPSSVPPDPEATLAALGLEHVASDRSLRTLSGGEQLRLLIALAVLRGPRLLVLDDPFSALGWGDVAPLLVWLRGLVQHGAPEAVLLSTTETEIALHADSVAVLSAGSCLFQGAPEALCRAALPEGVQRPLWVRCAEAAGRGGEPPPRDLTQGWGGTLL